MDFEGHLDPARGPDSIASSSPDLLRCLQTGYSNYLPEHAMCRPEVWNRIVKETRSSVASVGERAGLADWYRCEFQNEFCRELYLEDIFGVHLVGPSGRVRYGAFICIPRHRAIRKRYRELFTWLMPHLELGLNNLLHWDAYGSERNAALAGLTQCADAIAVVRHGKLDAASPTAHRLLNLQNGSVTNFLLAEFIRLAPMAGASNRRVLWHASDNSTFRLLTMKMPNGSLIVRFIPVCVPLSNIDETKKAAGTSISGISLRCRRSLFLRRWHSGARSTGPWKRSSLRASRRY